jgi:hypothetical protein
MSKKSDIVRTTRAGDQFHYRWAARRCLGLLNPSSGLVCITIEGISSDETPNENDGSGEEVIDVAEYYGASTVKQATKISYHQLKHSYAAGDPWTLSAFKKTLQGFFKRYEAYKQEAEDTSRQEVEFTYTTNRPVSQDVHDLFARIKQDALLDADARQWIQIKGYLNTLDDALAREFLLHFYIDDSNDVHWRQRGILIEELQGYIAGSDSESADQLWRLVVDKIAPEANTNRNITQEDVLRYLNTYRDALFPAPCRIENTEGYFARAQEDDFRQRILEGGPSPIIIHAEGGVGKTSLASRLSRQMPEHSAAILYDCFGNGEYRNPTQRRDEHRIGLVQIANELASLKLCHPLIPSPNARYDDYLRAFNYRLEQAIKILKIRNSDAKLVLFIDAADNAEMAAEEYQERAGFGKDLIRQHFPDGVVAVFLCRSHRISKLNPPIGYVNLPLHAFSETETEQLLGNYFPNATARDVQEFHRLSCQNPRVQATALEQKLSLPQTLLMLGPNPTTVEDTIRSIFEQSIAKHLDTLHPYEKEKIQILCQALAALRPLIPLEVLSLASGLEASAIRSFILDLGRPLSLTGDAVQFFDEPSETWFRETYKPEQAKLGQFVNLIRSLTARNSYVASALPQLMLEAGQYNELIELVLQNKDLPNDNPVDRRNASLQRLQFALKAALRLKRYDDAAKLALKAGGEMAGSSRQEALIQSNTDLTARLLLGHQLRAIVAGKTFSTSWHGGHHAYEACLLACNDETRSESRSYLRLAHKWVSNWSTLSKDERRSAEMSDDDIAEMAMCQLHLHGAESFVKELENWKPKSVAYSVGKVVFQRLIDLGQYNLIDEVVAHSLNNACILLAAISTQSTVLRYPESKAVETVINVLKKYPKQIKEHSNGLSYEEPVLSVVNSVIQASIACGSEQHSDMADVLDIYLPSPEKYFFASHSDEPRFTLLRANFLRAALRNQPLSLSDLAKPDVRKRLEKESHSHDRETQEFIESVGSVFPWHKLWTRVFLGQLTPEETDQEIELCINESAKNTRSYYRDKRYVSNEVSRLWMEILLMLPASNKRMDRLIQWKESLEQGLFTPALTRLVKLCACSEAYSDQAYIFAQRAFDIIDQDRMDSEGKIESYIDISRAIYVLSPEEATEYFNKAVEVADKVGEENISRWDAMLEVAYAASNTNNPQPELCYRLSRAAEVVYDFVARDKYFDWEGTIEALTKLCPPSSLAILSRWKDRGFCRISREFPDAIDSLVKLNTLTPSIALALIGYQYGWPYGRLVSNAVGVVEDIQIKRQLFESALRYIEIHGTSPKEWQELSELAAQNGWENKLLQYYQKKSADIKERLENRHNGSIGEAATKPSPQKKWNDIFSGLDVASPDSIQQAYRRMRSDEPPYYIQPFAKAFFQRVLAGQECAALEAIFSISDISLYDISGLYEAIPENWLNRNHIKSLLAKITEKVSRRHYYEITKPKHYQILPFERIAQCCSVTEQQIYRWVVEESAENPVMLESRRLFSLVGLITSDLTKQQAIDTLDYGLQILEKDIEEADGDGEWSLSIKPPQEIEAALAGYVWTSLASPKVSERWEAAHIVCLLCNFEKQEVLKYLASYALGENANAFHDAKLPLYVLSAKLWLLFALQRALKLGFTDSILHFKDFIRQSCETDEKHVIIREIAAKILLGLHSTQALKLTAKEVKRLQSINVSKHDVITSKTYRRELVTPTPSSVSEEEKYYFSYDFDRYWFESLGSVFGFNSTEVGNRALIFLRDKFAYKGKGWWSEDLRHQRKLYADGETHHSHGSYPQSEDLSFYHSYHSMMMVAGDLIDNVQRHQDTEYSDDELEDWLNRHRLTRSDGLWLSDRRDIDPTEEPAWKFLTENENWQCSIGREDLLKTIFLNDSYINVWGAWSYSYNDQKENIRISSVLVTKDKAWPLLFRLQKEPNPYSYPLPVSGGDFEVVFEEYQVRGWITESSNDSGIDERDPWAGSIAYPPLQPADWFVNQNNLKFDCERRVWNVSLISMEPALKSYVWGERESERNVNVSSESGKLLTANVNEIKNWLVTMDMDLIIEVQITRGFKYDSYRYKKKDFQEHLYPYRLVVIFRSTGQIEAL